MNCRTTALDLLRGPASNLLDFLEFDADSCQGLWMDRQLEAATAAADAIGVDPGIGDVNCAGGQRVLPTLARFMMRHHRLPDRPAVVYL
jgi:hypothetical protein